MKWENITTWILLAIIAYELMPKEEPGGVSACGSDSATSPTWGVVSALQSAGGLMMLTTALAGPEGQIYAPCGCGCNGAGNCVA